MAIITTEWLEKVDLNADPAPGSALINGSLVLEAKHIPDSEWHWVLCEWGDVYAIWKYRPKRIMFSMKGMYFESLETAKRVFDRIEWDVLDEEKKIAIEIDDYLKSSMDTKSTI